MIRALAVCVAGVLLALAAPGDAASRKNHFKPCPLDTQAPRFVHYYLGQEFEGLALRKTDYFGCAAEFQYGECPPDTEPEFEDSCFRPLMVQTTSACNDNFLPFVRRVPLRQETLRGAPALTLGRGDLEIYPGTAHVRLFGDDGQVRRAVRALQTAPGSPGRVEPGGPLPRVVRGSIGGTLYCGLSFTRLRAGRPRSCRPRTTGCRRVPIELGLRHMARIRIEVYKRERRPRPGYPYPDSINGSEFDAKRGITRHDLELGSVAYPPGRYSVAVQAVAQSGRHTSPRFLSVRLPRR